MTDEDGPLIDTLAGERLIAVTVLEDLQAAGSLGQALVDGGVHCVEVTLRAPRRPGRH